MTHTVAQERRAERKPDLLERMSDALSRRFGLPRSHKDGLTYEQELLHVFVVQQTNLSLAMPALAILMAAASLPWAPVSTVICWLGAILVCQGLQLFLCERLRKEGRRKVDLIKWGSRLASSELLYFLVWSALLLSFWDAASDVQRAFMVAIDPTVTIDGVDFWKDGEFVWLKRSDNAALISEFPGAECIYEMRRDLGVGF